MLKEGQSYYRYTSWNFVRQLWNFLVSLSNQRSTTTRLHQNQSNWYGRISLYLNYFTKNCSKGHFDFLLVFCKFSIVSFVTILSYKQPFTQIISFIPSSHGYQGTEGTWQKMSKPELSLEKDITSGQYSLILLVWFKMRDTK